MHVASRVRRLRCVKGAPLFSVRNEKIKSERSLRNKPMLSWAEMQIEIQVPVRFDIKYFVGLLRINYTFVIRWWCAKQAQRNNGPHFNILMGKETIAECGAERTDPICYSPFEVDCPHRAGLRRPSEKFLHSCSRSCCGCCCFQEPPSQVPGFLPSKRNI